MSQTTLKPGNPVPAFPDRSQSERAGVGRAHDLDSMIDLIGDVFDEMDAVFRVLSLRLVENFMADEGSEKLVDGLVTLKNDLEAHKEALRKIESFIAQP